MEYKILKPIQIFNIDWKINQVINESEIDKIFSEGTKEYLILDKWIKKAGFLEYIQDTRDEFVLFINARPWDIKFRMYAENLLIAYDQLTEKVKELNND